MSRFKIQYDVNLINEDTDKWDTLKTITIKTIKAETIEKAIKITAERYKGEVEFFPSDRSVAFIVMTVEQINYKYRLETAITIKDLEYE